MDSELQFNSYVFLGNVLNYLVHGIASDSALGASSAELAALNARIEPLKPNQILAGIASLGPVERTLLSRCCRYCLEFMSEDEASTLLGLPRELAEQLVMQLGLS